LPIGGNRQRCHSAFMVGVSWALPSALAVSDYASTRFIASAFMAGVCRRRRFFASRG
jgi:hypothetical protein